MRYRHNACRHSGKNQKYPSTTILKHANDLDKVNKQPLGCLQNVMPHDSYSIPIHLNTMTLEDIIDVNYRVIALILTKHGN